LITSFGRIITAVTPTEPAVKSFSDLLVTKYLCSV
jgi:hypothetical protein